jgi:hypothetical protein
VVTFVGKLNVATTKATLIFLITDTTTVITVTIVVGNVKCPILCDSNDNLSKKSPAFVFM